MKFKWLKNQELLPGPIGRGREVDKILTTASLHIDTNQKPQDLYFNRSRAVIF